VADSAGTTVWRWDQLEPFGNTVPDENPSGLGIYDLPLRFAGQRYDAETGLHYNYYRDFDPSLGIYKQSDPIGLRGGVNTYTYVNSSPLMYTDPLGLIPADSDPECFRRGECKCATAECAAGLPPIRPPKETCCDKDKLSACLTLRATSGMNCVRCAGTRGADKTACVQCPRSGASAAECFRENCGQDKCPQKNSCVAPDTLTTF
jgi:RHS repeat-associated protein